MATQVILVRHGRSSYNKNGQFQGSCDDSFLIDSGVEDAQRTGTYLRRFLVDHVFVSPLQRARQTLAVLRASNPDIPPAQVLHDLREIDLPQWQGLFYKQVRNEQADAYQCWKETPHLFAMKRTFEVCPYPNAGQANFLPVQELFERARMVWQRLIPQYPDQTLLIVSHGGTIQALIATALGLPPSVFHRIQQSNCGVSFLRFSQGLEHPAQLYALNLTQHLNESLPKLKEGKKGIRQLLFVDFECTKIECDRPAQILAQQAQAQSFPGLTTLLCRVSVQSAWQQLQEALTGHLTWPGIALFPGSLCVLHRPQSLNHVIIQSISRLNNSALT